MIESPIPTPGPGQIVIKVIVCGANPKDWSRAERYGGNINQGDDVAGIVHSVGKNVVEFKVSCINLLFPISTPVPATMVALRHEWNIASDAYRLSELPLQKLQSMMTNRLRNSDWRQSCSISRDGQRWGWICRIFAGLGIHKLPYPSKYLLRR